MKRRSAEEGVERNDNPNWIDGNGNRLLDQLKRGLQRNRCGFNVLSCRTEPGTDSTGVSPGMMVCMMLGMAHAGRNHRPVH